MTVPDDIPSQTHESIVRQVLVRNHYDKTRLMQILREVQEKLEWLPVGVCAIIAKLLGLPLAHVRGVAGFYSFFHTSPKGRYRVLWSDNITDQMAGNRSLMDRMLKKFWLEQGALSNDGLISIDTTSCTGLTDQGPAILVNYIPIARMNEERVDLVSELIRTEKPVSDWPRELFKIADNIRRPDILLKHDGMTGEALQKLHDPIDILEEIKISGLRGRGGAGFQTGQKWELCRNSPRNGANPAHFVVCNADEGEPGTFKDRVLLNSYPDLVFDGMTIAAFVTGAKKGFVYLRGEYLYLLDRLNNVLGRRQQRGLLGRNILGRNDFDFEIEIHVGAGAYVCGEESALIESLEGKRGIPRIRPPFPVSNGFLNQPTTVNNVETLAAAAVVILMGGTAYRAIGTEESTGTKIHSISGDCERPGIYEYPYGISIAEILDDCGAKNVQAVQIGGASGRCMHPSEFHRKISFEDVSTAGSMMIFGQDRDMVAVVDNFTRFFAHESCGFCTPCRVGTTLMKNLLDKMMAGHASRSDMQDIDMIDSVLREAAHCGLGTSSSSTIRQVIKKFPQAFENKLIKKDFEPAFNLDKALSKMRQVTGRDDPGAHLDPTGSEDLSTIMG